MTSILNVRIGTDGNRVVVAAQHSVPPDADIFGETYVTDDRGVRGNPDPWGEQRLLVAQPVDRH